MELPLPGAFNNWSYGRGVGSALWIKSNSRRGGYVRNLRVDRFTGSGFRDAVIAVTMRYDGQTGSDDPEVGGWP